MLSIQRDISSLLAYHDFPKNVVKKVVRCKIQVCASRSISQQVERSYTQQVDESDDTCNVILQGYKSTTVAHRFWKSIVKPGDTVVDATCGNGYDTLAMAKLALCDVHSLGKVIAIDKQSEALISTSTLLQSDLSLQQMAAVELRELCHSKLGELKIRAVRLIAFNLGYLPGSSKEVTTRKDTTLAALNASTSLLMPGGLISVAAYVGHKEGREEYEHVLEFSRSLSSKEWVCTLEEKLNRPSSPKLILLYKMKPRLTI